MVEELASTTHSCVYSLLGILVDAAVRRGFCIFLNRGVATFESPVVGDGDESYIPPFKNSHSAIKGHQLSSRVVLLGNATSGL